MELSDKLEGGYPQYSSNNLYPTKPISGHILDPEGQRTFEEFSSPAGQMPKTRFAGWRLVTNHSDIPLDLKVSGNDSKAHIRLHSKQLLVLAPNVLSAWEWIKQTECSVLELPTSVTKMDFSNPAKSELRLIEDSGIPEIMNMMRGTLDRQRPGYLDIAQSFSDIATVRLKRSLCKGRSESWSLNAQDNRYYDDITLYQVIESIIAKPQNDYSIPTLTRKTGLSKSSLIRAFRKATRQTPMQFVRRERARRAAYLIRSSSLSLTDIALECGFYDQSHMSRIVKQTLGVTPKQLG